ncbi:hypothetical protein ACOSP7_027598 [Xanthoceras sorbifolium]
MKSMVDDLALIGHPLSDDDIAVHVLTGLGPEYKELNAAIRARDTPISFEELYDKLADHEIFLKREESKKESSLFTAQFNQHFNSNKPKGNSNNRRGQNQNFNNSTNNWRPLQSNYNNNFRNNNSNANNRGIIQISHVHSRYQLADSLTKPLARQAHQLQRSKISVLDRPSILRGHDRLISDS